MNQYSVDFKLKIVKMVLNEFISKKEIMRTYNIATKTQRQWIHKYQTEGICGLINKREIRDKIPTDQEEQSVEALKHEILIMCELIRCCRHKSLHVFISIIFV